MLQSTGSQRIGPQRVLDQQLPSVNALPSERSRMRRAGAARERCVF